MAIESTSDRRNEHVFPASAKRAEEPQESPKPRPARLVLVVITWLAIWGLYGMVARDMFVTPDAYFDPLPLIGAYLLVRWMGWSKLWQLTLANTVAVFLYRITLGLMLWYHSFIYFLLFSTIPAILFWMIFHDTPRVYLSLRRVVAGFLIAPLTFSAAVLLIPIGHLNLERVFALALIPLILSQLIAYGISIALGLPTFLFLRSKGWLGLSHFMLAGSFLGLPAAFILVAIASGKSLAGSGGLGVSIIFIGAVTGALTAVIFWLIAIWGAPTESGGPRIETKI